MVTSTAKIKAIASLQAGLPTTVRDMVDNNSGHRLVTVRALRDGTIDRMAVQQFHQATSHGVSDRYRLRPGDLLVAARSTSLQTTVVPDWLDGAMFNARSFAFGVTQTCFILGYSKHTSTTPMVGCRSKPLRNQAQFR